MRRLQNRWLSIKSLFIISWPVVVDWLNINPKYGNIHLFITISANKIIFEYFLFRC